MAKDFRDRKVRWTRGVIKRILGNTVCIVEVYGMAWKRHFSQLRKCSQDWSDFNTVNEGVPLEIYMSDDGEDTDHCDDDAGTEQSVAVEFFDAEDSVLIQELLSSDETESAPAQEVPATDPTEDSASQAPEVRRSNRENEGQPPTRYSK